MSFEYLDHTADFKIRAKGKTLEETFEITAIAAFNFITDVTKIKDQRQKEISIKTQSLESLLYDFISELIFLLDTEGFLLKSCSEMKIQIGNDCTLTCQAHGDHYKKYETKGDLKAATYSEMVIKESKEGWLIDLVIDI